MKLKLLLILFMAYLFVSCENHSAKNLPPTVTFPYPNDPEIASEDGLAMDSLKSYLPDSVYYRGGYYKVKMHDLYYETYQAVLDKADEYVLHNRYLGRETYRVVLCHWLLFPMVFTVYEKNGRYWFNEKRLNKYPETMDVKYRRMDDSIRDSVVRADREAVLVRNRTCELSPGEWKYFKQLLIRNNYRNLCYPDDSKSNLPNDGGTALFEVHRPDLYRIGYVPEDVVIYCLKKSGNKHLLFAR